MANAFQDKIGVTAEERVTNAFNVGSNISTKNIGMLVERLRGIENKATLANNLKEDQRIFGGHSTDMYSSYVVESLFNNAGGYGVNLYQIRLIGAGSAAASANINNASADAQTLVSVTSQNAGVALPQINKINATEVEIGDSFSVTIEGTDNIATTQDAFSETVTFVAVTATEASVLLGLKGLLDVFLATLTDVYTTAIVAGELVITGPNDAPFTVTTATINVVASEEIMKVFAGRMGEQDKGTWGNDLRVRAYPIGHVNGSPDGYRLEVLYNGYQMEYYISNGADWDSLVSAVNQRSEYITLVPTDLGVALIANPVDVTLTGGIYVAPEATDFEPALNESTQAPEGMRLFEGVDVQLLACPEVFSTDFAKKCIDFAEETRKFFVFSLPYLATESVVETYFNALLTNVQSAGASYLNWIEVPADRDGNKIWVPGIGYALGAGYVRKAGMYNGYVWTPPAGIETVAKGIYRFTHDNLTDDTMGRYVKKWRTNVVKYIKNVGFCLYSSRTYSTDTLFESIHVRLETNWLIENILVRNQRFLQRLASPTVLKDTRLDNLIWMKNLYEQGGIEASIPFEQAVIVETNILKENRKELELEISWIPPECIEHIHIKLNRNDGILILNF